MARIAVTGMFDRREDAAEARQAIESLGIAPDDIGILANSTEGQPETEDGPSNAVSGSGAGAGAGIGTILGGGAGLLTGLGIMAIPGVGPIVAAGWLAATVAGAAVGALAGGATGGLVGAMTNAGVEEDAAHVYAEGVRRGGTILTIQVDDGRRDQIKQVLFDHGAVDARVRGDAYRSSGWKQYDPASPVYTPEEMARERNLYGRSDPQV
jgi:hypothetical protein